MCDINFWEYWLDDTLLALKYESRYDKTVDGRHAAQNWLLDTDVWIRRQIDRNKSTRLAGNYFGDQGCRRQHIDPFSIVNVFRTDEEKTLWEIEDRLFRACRPPPWCDLVDREVNKRKARLQRMREKIEGMFRAGDCYFLTYTFSDKYINGKDDTLRKYCLRHAGQYNDFIGNKDFGGQFGRIHFHFLVQSGQRIDRGSWKYGILYVEKVVKNRNSKLRLSSYSVKLAYHGFKVPQRIIYKRREHA